MPRKKKVEIDSKLQDKYFSGQEDQIQTIKDASDKQIERLEEQIKKEEAKPNPDTDKIADFKEQIADLNDAKKDAEQNAVAEVIEDTTYYAVYEREVTITKHTYKNLHFFKLVK